MALVIGVPRGKSFYIRDTRLTVTKIVNELKFEVVMETPAMDYKYTVTDSEAVVLHRADWDADVKLSAGLNGSETLARVVVDAPKEIEVLRDSLYQKKEKQAQ